MYLGDGICNEYLLTESCCFDMGDCSHKSNMSVICPPCGQKESDGFIQNGQCDNFLNHASCCFDGGDCGCPTCHSNKEDIGNERCDISMDTEDCCYDGGDCLCLELASTSTQCCPESGSKWCFPPSSICPTCSLSLAQSLNNDQCDHRLIDDQDCCFDAPDCYGGFQRYFKRLFFVNNRRYQVNDGYRLPVDPSFFFRVNI